MFRIVQAIWRRTGNTFKAEASNGRIGERELSAIANPRSEKNKFAK
jgi:hypothetical protein